MCANRGPMARRHNNVSVCVVALVVLAVELACPAPLLTAAKSLVSTPETSDKGNGVAPPAEKWLFPILVYGPSNQIVGFKESLVLAHLLGRTLILPHIYDHHLEVKKHNVQNTFPFDSVFDPQPFKQVFKVILKQDFVASGWDGKVDATIYWKKRDFRYARGLYSRKGAPRLLMSGTQVCSPKYAGDVIANLSRYDVVAAVVYNDVAHCSSSSSWDTRYNATNVCLRLFHEASRLMYHAAHIQEASASFIRDHLSHPFLAVHIRPYGDSCLNVWREGEFSPEKCQEKCRNPLLQRLVAQQSRTALQLLKLPVGGKKSHSVFVATHPDIRHTIVTLFKEEGLVPVFLSPEDVVTAYENQGSMASNFSALSPSLYLFIEQEIAAHSAIFIGTQESSISCVIRQERGARGIPPAMNRVFEAAEAEGPSS